MTEMSDLCYLQKPRLTTNVTSRGGNFAETSKSTIQSFSVSQLQPPLYHNAYSSELLIKRSSDKTSQKCGYRPFLSSN